MHITSIENAHNKGSCNRKLAFKNNAPFINCISKINGVLIENAKDLDAVIPMYNFLEYCKNYRKITGSLWSYYRDEPSNGFVHDGNEKITISFRGSKSFEHISTIKRSLDAGNLEKDDVEIVDSLKHFSNFWRCQKLIRNGVN